MKLIIIILLTIIQTAPINEKFKINLNSFKYLDISNKSKEIKYDDTSNKIRGIRVEKLKL
jgi:hypothetical protein